MNLILPDDVKRERLISPEYLAQQKKLHENPAYGVASVHFAPVVAKLMNQHDIQTLLDYGAGKGRLAETLMTQKMVGHKFRVQHYEPTNPAWADPPEPCEMVACIDVLEHIEPDRLDNVLDDLQRVTDGIGVFSVSTMPAQKVLDDGRNAHLIIQPSSWWMPKIQERFDIHVFQRTPDGFFVIVMAYEVEDGTK